MLGWAGRNDCQGITELTNPKKSTSVTIRKVEGQRLLLEYTLQGQEATIGALLDTTEMENKHWKSAAETPYVCFKV